MVNQWLAAKAERKARHRNKAMETAVKDLEWVGQCSVFRFQG